MNKKSFLLLFYFIIAGPIVFAETILIQSTTSTKNSGFFDYILPIIENEIGIKSSVIAVGTGAAIKNAEKCDGDVLLVHATEREKEFIKNKFGIFRQNLMYNDFVLVGPPHDPALVSQANNIVNAFKYIALGQHLFTSRGDDSGTNIKELEIWKLSETNPKLGSGNWYLELGSGMGSTLNTGIQLNAYILTDRSTWIKFQNKLDYVILFQEDPLMFNQYGIILVNPAHCPNVRSISAKKLVNWMISDIGQKYIGSYKVNGEQLFFPNAP